MIIIGRDANLKNGVVITVSISLVIYSRVLPYADAITLGSISDVRFIHTYFFRAFVQHARGEISHTNERDRLIAFSGNTTYHTV